MFIGQFGLLGALDAMRLFALLAPDGGQEDQSTEGPAARVWVKENRVSSDKQTKIVQLSDLLGDAKELIGKWAKVDGKIRLNGVFDYAPLLNEVVCDSDGKNCPTNSGFNQVQLYHSLTGLSIYLGLQGFDMDTMIGKSKNGRITAHADAVEDMNAWFSPQSEEETFGTSGGKWDLASDNDVTKHETGHFVLHRLHPGLTSWYSAEGGAIHEGFADALAALYENDPEMSEDFLPATGKAPTKTDGLRNVNNALTLEQAGSEVHDRGRAYGGFFWGLKKRVETKIGQGRELSNYAADMIARSAVNHGAFYTTSKPKPVDFVRAVTKGAEALAKVNKLGMDFAQFRQFIIAEALARGMIKTPNEADERPQPTPDSVESAIARFTRGDRRLSFDLISSSKGIGGSRDNFQEFYLTRDGKKAKVVASGAFAHRDAAGRLNAVSLDDARTFGPAEVNEEIKVSYEAALKSIEDQANKELANARALRARPQGDIREKQMDVRIAEAAVKRAKEIRGARTRLQGEKPTPVYVILPDGKNESGQSELYYEFQMGLSLYYVSARDSKKVVVKRDVLRD